MEKLKNLFVVVCKRTYVKSKAPTIDLAKAKEISLKDMDKFLSFRSDRIQLITDRGLFNPTKSGFDLQLFEDVEGLIYLSETNEDIEKAVSAIKRMYTFYFGDGNQSLSE